MKINKEKEINWDTSLNNGQFPKTVKKIFDKYYFSERKKFVSWIGIISKNNFNNIDWWVSPPVSRNLYSSDLYRNICIHILLYPRKKYTRNLIDNN